jgi:hypothetical protein
VQTRIDQIWVSRKVKEGLQRSDIEEMDLVTGSDHNLIWGDISTTSFLGYNSSKLRKTNLKKTPRRKIYLYQNASVENWEDYRSTLDNILKETSVKSEKKYLEATSNKTKIEELINEE